MQNVSVVLPDAIVAVAERKAHAIAAAVKNNYFYKYKEERWLLLFAC